MAVAAEAAIRILNGEKAGDIKVAPTGFKLPRFDSAANAAIWDHRERPSAR